MRVELESPVLRNTADIGTVQKSERVPGFARTALQGMTIKLLLGIMLLAVGLRVLSAVYQGNSIDTLPGIHDQVSYDELARRLITGHGFSFATAHWPVTRANEPTAHWSYLYTLYLSASYSLFGLYPLVARVVQAIVVGILHTWLAWRIGNRIFGSTIGLIAALFSAVYLYFVYYAGALITEPFYITGILWTLDAALRLAEHRRLGRAHAQQAHPVRVRSEWWLWAELGLAIGITALLRQLFLLFVPFLFLWLWWSRERSDREITADEQPVNKILSPSRKRLLGGMALASAVVVLLILPWTLRNYRAFGQFVPLNTNSGYAFFWGNHPNYGTRFTGILPEDGPTYLDLLPRDLLHLNEAQLDQALLRQGLGFVADDPVRYLWLSLSRTQEYFKFWPSAESSLISNVARVASFGLALPFILLGLWRSFGLVRQPHSPYQQAAIVLLYLFAAVYTTIHLLVWTLIRYRLPVDSVLLIFAAVGLHQLASWTFSHIDTRPAQPRNTGI